VDEPKITANRVIKQMIDHSGADLEVTAQDYSMIRIVFRNQGGSWEKVIKGDSEALQLLSSVVASWATQPQRTLDFV